MRPDITTIQTNKRPSVQIEEERKKQRTDQTDGPGVSVAAESPMDETDDELGGPSANAPDTSSLDIPRSTSSATEQHDADARSTDGNVPSPVLALPRELIQKCFGFPVPTVNALSVENCATLLSSARAMAKLARINKEMNRFQEELSAMRWTHQLAQSWWLNYYHNPCAERTKSNIQILIDENAYEPTVLQAPPQHTRALMAAAGESLHMLYVQLQYRVAFKFNMHLHIDWDQLPVHALLVGYLKFGRTAAFDDLEKEIRGTLRKFSLGVQAQVYADLFALRPNDEDASERLKGKLSKLDKQALTPQLKGIEDLRDAFKASRENRADLAHVGPLLETLPPEAPWNLTALVTIRLLSRLNEKNLLTLEQFQTLVRRATEMLRHFMSLAAPDARDHPLTEAAAFLLSTTLAPVFMQLSPQEKARFVQICSSTYPSPLFNRLADDPSLPVSERLSLIREILGFEGIPEYVVKPLRKKLSLLYRKLEEQS